MNYRHAYHAGNFADVLKHAVLALVIEHLKRKPAPFRVIDTHAGVGLYDLSGAEAAKTGEWRDGIGRLFGAALAKPVAELLAPYFSVVRQENPSGRLERYPGSPLIARRLLRRGDRLIANELHPEDGDSLRRLFAGDPQTKVLALDGWVALKALLPPKERRGVVLVDPPFEEPGESRRLVAALREAARRFATGTALMWYPIKDPRVVSTLQREVADLGLPKILGVELSIRAASGADVLSGAGLVILNPPFTLAEKLEVLVPFLAGTLGEASGAGARLEWLTRGRAAS